MGWQMPQGPLPPNVDRHYVIDIVAWVGAAVATLFVTARLFSRYHLLRSADWLDAVVAFAALLGIVATVLNTVAGHYGAGRHIYYLSPYQIQQASLFGTAATPFSQMAMALPKVVAAAVILRIAGPIAGRRTKIYFYSLTGGLCVLSALYCIFIFVQCTPAFALWTDAPGAQCWPRSVVYIFGIVVSGISAFIDLNLAIYPAIVISRLQMPLRRKIQVCVLMGLGILSTICAGFKIPHLKDQANPDVTYSIVDLVCWTLAEMDLILITSCVPFMRVLVLWLLGKPYNSMSEGPHTVEKTPGGGGGGGGSSKGHNGTVAARSRTHFGTSRAHKLDTFVSTRQTADSDIEMAQNLESRDYHRHHHHHHGPPSPTTSDDAAAAGGWQAASLSSPLSNEEWHGNRPRVTHPDV